MAAESLKLSSLDGTTSETKTKAQSTPSSSKEKYQYFPKCRLGLPGDRYRKDQSESVSTEKRDRRKTSQRIGYSIQSEGLLQPIIVRSTGKGYELIAGERRLRAFKF